MANYAIANLLAILFYIKIDIIIVNNIMAPVQIRAPIVRLPRGPSSTLITDLKPGILNWI
jgi:hypothetical protein